MDTQTIINKTMDLEDLKSREGAAIIDELNNLIDKMKNKDLNISSWYGSFELSGDTNSSEWINRGFGYRGLEEAVDDRNFPWFLYWEIVWIVLNNEFLSKHKVLDLGGSSSLFSYYLASKGIDVTTIDLQKELVDNANLVAEQMGWNLKNYVMDMRVLKFDSKFDHITSLCVYEHIPMYERVGINSKIKELLVDKGKFSITFDYRNPSKLARISSAEDVYNQFVKPSGLRLIGNQDFYDNGKSYLLHPYYSKKAAWKWKLRYLVKGDICLRDIFRTKEENDYTFGALFLENCSIF